MGLKIVADDYGMLPEINHAVQELIRNNVVSKVSVMANEYIEYMQNDTDKGIEFGLHANLTANLFSGGSGQQNISPLRLIYLIYSRQLTIDQINDMIKYQLDVLIKRGFKVAYIDTHHHVHVIPMVLKALIGCAETAGIKSIRAT